MGALATEIRLGNPAAVEHFYSAFGRGLRFLLARKLGFGEVDDHLHNCILLCMQSLSGDSALQNPECLAGFVRTVVLRYVAKQYAGGTRARAITADSGAINGVPVCAALDPEQSLARREQMALARRVLADLSDRDREVLQRFYLDGQTAEQICREMDFTDVQFRNIKCRAKAKLAERCARGMTPIEPKPTRSPKTGRLDQESGRCA